MATQALALVKTGAIQGGQLSLPRLRSSLIWAAETSSEQSELMTPAIRQMLPSALAECLTALEPADRELVIKGLSSALTLTAGVGMGEGERKAWLASAAMALNGIPGDLLRRGIEVARRTADHPAKIVPTIITEIESEWGKRKREHARLKTLMALPEPERDLSEEDRCTPEQAAAILAEFGLKRNPLEWAA